jgi:hypothetical protein
MRPLGDEQRLLHYSLPSVLAEGDVLVLHLELGVLSHLVRESSQARIVAEEQFSAAEIDVLWPMLEFFPEHCPNEVLYASFHTGSFSSKELIASCRELLQEALQAGIYNQEMRAVRSAVSRVRLKIRSFGIDITALLATGYLLSIRTGDLQEAFAV